jgi:hypothetical protein
VSTTIDQVGFSVREATIIQPAETLHAIWLLYASRRHLLQRVRTVTDFLKNELRQRIGSR